MEFFTALSVLAAICVSGGVGFYLNKHLNAKRIGDATELATRIVEESRKEAQAQKKEILLQGQDELFNQKRELEHEFKERERELKARDRKLQEQGERLEEKLEKATEKEHELLSVEKDLSKKERKLAELEETLNERIDEQEHRLQEVSGLTAEEARQRLFAEIESRTRHEAAKMMRLIEAEARETADRKAKEIIARLSDLSRKNTSLTFQYVSPDELVRKVLAVASPARPPHVEVRTDLACRHLWLRGNEIQLSQMLLNLILNAYHAMEPGGGTLTVATRPEGEFLCFQVSDTGSGISPEVLPHIFEPFFTTKERGKGTGLGLAIVRQVMEEHKGTITIDTAPGRGTTMLLRFPTITPPEEDT